MIKRLIYLIKLRLGIIDPPTLTEVVTRTLQKNSYKLADNIRQNNALLARLWQKIYDKYWCEILEGKVPTYYDKKELVEE